MYPRTEYEMTKEDLQTLMDASKPVAAMMIGGSVGRSPQENANAAWGVLGDKLGLDSMTVNPMSGKGTRFFTAIPSETEEAIQERVLKEAEEARIKKIDDLTREISEKTKQLMEMTG